MNSIDWWAHDKDLGEDLIWYGLSHTYSTKFTRLLIVSSPSLLWKKAVCSPLSLDGQPYVSIIPGFCSAYLWPQEPLCVPQQQKPVCVHPHHPPLRVRSLKYELMITQGHMAISGKAQIRASISSLCLLMDTGHTAVRIQPGTLTLSNFNCALCSLKCVRMPHDAMAQGVTSVPFMWVSLAPATVPGVTQLSLWVFSSFCIGFQIPQW